MERAYVSGRIVLLNESLVFIRVVLCNAMS